jgi:hypothetical protein
MTARRTVQTAIILLLALTLAACGGFRDSRLNPFNWFGRSVEAPTTLEPEGGYNAGDNRALVGDVTSLTIDRTPNGAVVTAFGLPPTQGWWDAELVAENGGEPVDGVLTFRFVVSEPRRPYPAGNPRSREVSAATFLSNVRLDAINRIVVSGERNSRSSQR